MPSRPAGQLPEPSLKDLADLAVGKAFEGLLYGKLAVSVPDAVAVARLAWQVERDQAIPERDAALRQLEKWQQDMTEFTWALRMVLDRQYPGSWPAVMTEVRKHCLLRRGNRQPGWRGRLPFWLSVIRRPASSSRLASMAAATSRSASRVSDSSGPVTLSSTCCRSLAARRRRLWRFERSLVSYWPPCIPLYGLPGAPGPAFWCAAQRRPGDLDDRELL